VIVEIRACQEIVLGPHGATIRSATNPWACTFLLGSFAGGARSPAMLSGTTLLPGSIRLEFLGTYGTQKRHHSVVCGCAPHVSSPDGVLFPVICGCRSREGEGRGVGAENVYPWNWIFTSITVLSVTTPIYSK